MIPTPAVVLASASSVRARLLASAGIAFTIDPAIIDEDRIKREARADGSNAEDAARRLAAAKALTVSARHPGAIVVGADQMLAADGRWFDKPRDRDDARENLLFLRCREQRLISAVAVGRDGTLPWQIIDVARLWMRAFSEGFVDDYLDRAGDEVRQSVGGCKLEGYGIQFFERIEGDFFTILGLPLLPLLTYLRAEGVLRQ